MNYLDFELEIASGTDGAYNTRVLRSPAGEASGSMTFPLDTLALQNRLQALQLALLKSGRGRRRVELPEAQLVRQFGTELWNALFVGDIVSRFDVSRSEARQQDMGLRVKLRISAPELAALPWEFLFDSRRGSFLALSATTPLVRYTPLAQPIEPLAVVPPLRVLGLIADPVDLDPLDVGREKERLEQALGRLREHSLVELSWVPNGTWRDLQDALRHGPWHIFHFIGHGGFDEARREGLIALVDENHKAHRMTATELGLLLGDHEPLRLAVLNSCDSAKAEDTDVFSSTAASLVRQGTPAVVAMQYEITDLAAIEFSRSFYEAIADGVPVDSAVSEARKGIAVSISGTLEWGTPVLHTRAPDGVLFTIAPEHAASAFIDRAEPPPVAVPALPAAAIAIPAQRPLDRLRRWLNTAGGRRWMLPFGLVTVAVAVVLGAVLLRPGSPAAPVITLSAFEATVGSAVQIRGSGYLPGETVTVFSQNDVIARVVAGPDGGFTATWIVGATTDTTVGIQAVGTSSGRTSSQSLAIHAGQVAANDSPSPGPTQSPASAPLDSGPASGSLEPSGFVSPSVTPSKATTAPTTRPATATPVTVHPTPTPTKRPATPSPTPAHQVIFTTPVTLADDSELDADAGVASANGADMWFNSGGTGFGSLIPENGGGLSFFGGSAPGYAACAGAAVSTSSIPVATANINDYLCLHTASGRVSQLRILDLTDTITLQVRTWN